MSVFAIMLAVALVEKPSCRPIALRAGIVAARKLPDGR
jgi:hypothetical protein